VSEAKTQKKLLKDVTSQIKQLSESDRYLRRAKLLRTVPGIALINAMAIFTEVKLVLVAVCIGLLY